MTTETAQPVTAAAEATTPLEGIENIAGKWLEEVDEGKPPEEAQDDDPGDGEGDQGDEGEGDAGDEAGDDDPQPIDPPVSWTAEEKESFKALPREIQETVNRREAERERFVQTKASEAQRARHDAETEALSKVAEIQRQAVEQLQQLSAQILPQRPDPRYLQGNDADRAYFYQQQGIFEAAQAQQQELQREAQARYGQLQQAEQELKNREAAAFHQTLSEQFPEYLDPSQSAKLRQELGSIASELGYPPELIAEASATDVLAIRKASDWKAKAAKYDALMAKQMSSVRDAKNLPKVSRPGSSASKAQTSAARRAEARDTAIKTRDPLAFAEAIGL